VSGAEDGLAIAAESPDTPEALALLAASEDAMHALYPAEANFLLDVAGLMAPDVTFLVARQHGEAMGCGAVARRDEWAEIKRLFVAPQARGRGLSKRLLAALEAEAVSRGIGTVMLETGDLQPEALGLYRSTGYAERGPFADYPAGPPSVFFEKRLE